MKIRKSLMLAGMLGSIGAHAQQSSFQCLPCPAGQYQSAKGQTGCRPCPAGTYCPPGSTGAKACPLGTHTFDSSIPCQGIDSFNTLGNRIFTFNNGAGKNIYLDPGPYLVVLGGGNGGAYNGVNHYKEGKGGKLYYKFIVNKSSSLVKLYSGGNGANGSQYCSGGGGGGATMIIPDQGLELIAGGGGGGVLVKQEYNSPTVCGGQGGSDGGGGSGGGNYYCGGGGWGGGAGAGGGYAGGGYAGGNTSSNGDGSGPGGGLRGAPNCASVTQISKSKFGGMGGGTSGYDAKNGTTSHISNFRAVDECNACAYLYKLR